MWWIIAAICIAPEPGRAVCESEIWGPYQTGVECRRELMAKAEFLQETVTREVLLTMVCDSGGEA